MKVRLFLSSLLIAVSTVVAATILQPYHVQAGIYNADTDVTYKEYWVPHSEFTGGTVTGSNCEDTSGGGEFYLEPWPCAKSVKLNIPDNFSGALRIEIYLDLWRNHNEHVASFRVNNGPLHIPNVGADWSRTPYIATIPKEEWVTGVNTISFPAASAGYHIHDIAVRIYFDASHPLLANGTPISAPNGSLTTIGDGTTSYNAAAGGVLNVNSDQVVLNAQTTTAAKFIEFHGYYDGYDEDNNGLTRDWHNLGRNNWFPGGTSPQATGGTIDHIGTVAAPTPGTYNTTWQMPYVTNQGGVRFKVRIVADGGTNAYIVREAAGGISGNFTLQRTRRVVAFTDPAFADLVLHHSHDPNVGQFPDVATRELNIDVVPTQFSTAYVLGAYWNEPTVAINGNNTFYPFGGADVWTVAVQSQPVSSFQQGINTFTYNWTGGFGQFVEKPGPMVVLKQSNTTNDSTPPTVSNQDPAPNATGVAHNKSIVVAVADTGLGVDIATLSMKVNGNTVYPTISGFSSKYTLMYNPPTDFAPDSNITVEITAKDLANNTMPPVSYSFQTSSPDSTGPVIANVACVAGSSSVHIQWSTDEPATTKLEYGLTTAYGNEILGNTLKSAHAATIDNLTTGQVIHYKIAATDAANNTSSKGDLTCAPVGTQSIRSDDFNRCALNPELWTIYDPQDGTAGQATVRATGTQLEITIPGGIDHDVWRSGISAPHIMQAIGNINFTIEAKFESVVTQKYQMQGLLIKEDSNNLVRISFENVGGGQTNLSVYLFTNGEPAIAVAQSIPTKNEPLYLRLDRNNSNWEIAYRHENDANFTSGGAFRFTHTLTASEIGFFAGNVGDVSVNGAAPAFTAIFDYFFNDAARISPEDSTALYLHSLATQPTSGGIANSVPVSPTVGSPANCGSPIQLTATAQPGWSFDRWISTKGSVSGIANPLVTDFDFDEDVTAVFKQDAYTLDRSVIGSGAITVAPLADTYTYSDVVQLTAVPAPGWSFAGWSGAATGNNLTTSFRITGNAAVTATFTQDEYTLTVHTVGDATGTVTVTPPQQTYHYSDVVTLQANPAPGAIFAGWSGALTGDQLAKSLTITGNADVTATFVKDLFALNVSIVSEHADDEAGDGGTVTATPDKTNYVFNETVNLVAEAKPGWSFSGWSGDAIGATPAIAVIMTDNKAVTATFTQEQYTVTRTTSGTGQGTIVVSPTQTAYLYGAVVTVEAVPADGSIFTGWSGAVSGSAPAQTLTITADSAIEAAFALREYHINATVVGGQDGEVPGTVTIAPAAPYHFGDQVTLTAIANEGYHFTHWTVEPDLTAASATDLTEPTLTISVSDDVNYFANFEKDEVNGTSNSIFLPLISSQ